MSDSIKDHLADYVQDNLDELLLDRFLDGKDMGLFNDLIDQAQDNPNLWEKLLEVANEVAMAKLSYNPNSEPEAHSER